MSCDREQQARVLRWLEAKAHEHESLAASCRHLITLLSTPAESCDGGKGSTTCQPGRATLPEATQLGRR